MPDGTVAPRLPTDAARATGPRGAGSSRPRATRPGARCERNCLGGDRVARVRAPNGERDSTGLSARDSARGRIPSSFPRSPSGPPTGTSSPRGSGPSRDRSAHDRASVGDAPCPGRRRWGRRARRRDTVQNRSSALLEERLEMNRTSNPFDASTPGGTGLCLCLGEGGPRRDPERYALLRGPASSRRLRSQGTPSEDGPDGRGRGLYPSRIGNRPGRPRIEGG